MPLENSVSRSHGRMEMPWWLGVAAMWLQQSEWGEGRFCATGDEAAEVMDMS